MKEPADNPFERFDLDPREGPRAITDRLRELAEDADEADRVEIRAAWEELTLHPLRRLRAALFAHPRHPDARCTTPDQAPLVARKPALAEPLTLADFAPRPSVAHALVRLAVPSRDAPPALPNLDDDPVLSPPDPAPAAQEKKR